MTLSEEIERGRVLIDSGADPLDMLDQLAMVAYLRHQREIVRFYGCCGQGEELWVSPMGKVCCKHTREPCPRWQKRALLELYSLINRGDNGEERTGNSRWARRRNHTSG